MIVFYFIMINVVFSSFVLRWESICFQIYWSFFGSPNFSFSSFGLEGAGDEDVQGWQQQLLTCDFSSAMAWTETWKNQSVQSSGWEFPP